MSNYHRFECLDHNPPLPSVDEFTQHYGDRHYWSGIVAVYERPVMDPEYRHVYWKTTRIEDYFREAAWDFLLQHRECNIGIIDEYGDATELPGLREALTKLEETKRTQKHAT